MTDAVVNYRLRVLDSAAHLFEVQCRVAVEPGVIEWTLPDWIPGSYMIRDFARHIVHIQAQVDDRVVAFEKCAKSRWCAQVETQGVLCLSYQVYAWDLSVRGSHLDQNHGFINGTSVFLSVTGTAGLVHQLEIVATHELSEWRVATSMLPVAVDDSGYGLYQAVDYDELIDHPVEMGGFERIFFEACGVPHELVLTGKYHTDAHRVCQDLQRICEAQIHFFGEPAPMERYVFLVMVVGDGYGGLEHRASTALMISRDSLPIPGELGVSEEYLKFLGLCSHEYFHTWNVKRIRPAEFVPFDLSREVHTRQLWAFEGITSYYDDLFLLRAGLIDENRYLDLVAQTLTRVYRGSGRLKQNLSDSSFDAWTKFYKQDENAPNAIVSYYAKGMLVALSLDLVMRQRTDNRVGLDQVMRTLWQEYLAGKEGIGDGYIEELAEQLCGSSLTDFFDTAIRGCKDLPLDEYLAAHGVEMRWRAAVSADDKGGSLERSTTRDCASLGLQMSSEAKIGFVFHGGAAHAAGISAGDELVAWNGLRLDASRLKRNLLRFKTGDQVKISVFRRDELMEFQVVLQSAPLDTCILTTKEGREELRDEWLHAS